MRRCQAVPASDQPVQSPVLYSAALYTSTPVTGPAACSQSAVKNMDNGGPRLPGTLSSLLTPPPHPATNSFSWSYVLTTLTTTTTTTTTVTINTQSFSQSI